MKNKLFERITKGCLAGVLLLTVAFFAVGCGQDESRKSEQEAYRQYGINCLNNAQYEDAVDAFQKSLDMSTGRIGELEIDTCLYKAQAQYMSGDVDAAFETYDALIEYNDCSRAYYMRGCLNFAIGNQKDGLKDFDKAVANDKKNFEIYISIHETLVKYNLESQGKEFLNKALDISGKSGEALMNRGRVYMLLDEYDKALSELNLAIDKDMAKANFYIGEVYNKKGENEKAQAYYDKYLKNGEVTSEELYSMGSNLMDIADYDNAISFFKKGLALEKVTNKQQIMRDLVVAYEESGDFSSAKTLMEEYIKDYPNDEDALREYTFLETR